MEITKAELCLLKEALEGAQYEFKELSLSEEWYLPEPDVLDLLEASCTLVKQKLRGQNL